MKFSIRDLLWLTFAVAVVAGIYWWRNQPPPKPPQVETKTVEVYLEP